MQWIDCVGQPAWRRLRLLVQQLPLWFTVGAAVSSKEEGRCALSAKQICCNQVRQPHVQSSAQRKGGVTAFDIAGSLHAC